MPVPLLDLRAQYDTIREELDEAVRKVCESQGFVLGPEVEGLEREIADYIGVPHAIGCASGTDALLLPLKALDPETGDEVIVPAFTFFATAGAVWNSGFTPVFCDVDGETFNVTPETLDAAWTDRPRAVVPVHLFGQMAPMSKIQPLAEGRGAFVLEDAAQAIGAHQRLHELAGDAMAGSVGDAGALSFFPTKNLGGFGDAGMITTHDDDLADKVRKLRVHGGQQMYHHEMVGTNSRLDALQAAILRRKLPHLDGWAEARRSNAALYDDMLADVAEVATPATAEGNFHVYNQYTIRVCQRDELRAFLSEREIGSGVYYPVPLHVQECFAALEYRIDDLPVSASLCEQVMSLPIFPELGEERLTIVAEAIREFYGK